MAASFCRGSLCVVEVQVRLCRVSSMKETCNNAFLPKLVLPLSHKHTHTPYSSLFFASRPQAFFLIS